MTTTNYKAPICKCITLQTGKPILDNSINDWENGTTYNAFLDSEDGN